MSLTISDMMWEMAGKDMPRKNAVALQEYSKVGNKLFLPAVDK